MFTLKFKTKDLPKLIAELESADSFSPTLEDIFEPMLYPNNVLLDEHGRTEIEAEEAGDYFWPSAKHIDLTRIKPKLQLVADHGVYLITNAKLEGTPASRGTVVYADGCDPDKDEHFYDRKCLIFGGDDGAVDIPLSWAKTAIEGGKRLLKIQCFGDRLNLVA